MRRLAFLTAACGLLPAIAAAQQCAAPCYTSPQCAAPATAAPAVAAPARNFLRAPGTGQTAGESNSIGLRGITLHIPEMRIGLPTLELPSLMRFRREAEMVFDHARGPLVNGDILDFGNLPATGAPAAPAPATAAPAPVNCIPQSPACAAPGLYSKLDSANETMEVRMARLEGLERELTSLRASCARDVVALTAANQTAQSSGSGRVAGSAGGGKPSSGPSGATVSGSRPVSRSNVTQVRHQEPLESQEHYIIPAQSDHNAGELTPPLSNSGLSTPVESAAKPESVALSKFASKLRLRR